VPAEEKLGDIGARLEHKPGKLLKRLAQETGVSKSGARRLTQLLELRPYKTATIHALQPRDPASRVHFYSWFLQSVVEGDIDPQLTLFSDEAWFHLQGHIKLRGLIPQANYTDRATAAVGEVVPTFAGRGVLGGQRNEFPLPLISVF
jgi:hypothetical protein